jgi:hypothetical protein
MWLRQPFTLKMGGANTRLLLLAALLAASLPCGYSLFIPSLVAPRRRAACAGGISCRRAPRNRGAGSIARSDLIFWSSNGIFEGDDEADEDVEYVDLDEEEAKIEWEQRGLDPKVCHLWCSRNLSSSAPYCDMCYCPSYPGI